MAVTGGTSGIGYPVTVWAEDKLATCFDHAYGPTMVSFLTSHPCSNTARQLLSTKVNGTGKTVGVSIIQTFFESDSADNPSENATAFKALVAQDGTGSINDLMREGYRLSGGPTKVPSPDAFATYGEDTGVVVIDVWYLAGSTPSNAPELVALAQDLFLQTFTN